MTPDLIAARLAGFLAAEQPRAFDWKDAHCCMLPARWVASIEGAAVTMPQVRSQWSALAAVLRRGGLVRAVSTVLGRQPVAPDQARPGDLVAFAAGAVALGRIGVIGIVLARLEPPVALVMAGAAPTLHPISAACAAWKVCP